MKFLLLMAVIILTVPAYTEPLPVKPITELQALEIAKKQLASARPDLHVKDPVPHNHFVPAGPGSGGGPKWVIGFETMERKSGWKWIYYVTVFPDGQTSEKEIRPGAMSGNSSDGSCVTPLSWAALASSHRGPQP